jgi:SAM-dependent methyltransferase
MSDGAPREGDAWGMALLEYLETGSAPQPMLEVDTGETGPAMHPDWFFRPFDEWDWWERELFGLITDGPVLDLGCGAGRASLHLQQAGLPVTALDSSEGAVEVTRRRGVADVILGDLNDPPSTRPWQTVLLLCGNLGLGGSWDGNRRLLTELANRSVPGALLVTDSVESRGPAEIGLRIHYRDAVTPWWRQRNVGAREVAALVAGTGWEVERHIEAGTDHGMALRRVSPASLPGRSRPNPRRA